MKRVKGKIVLIDKEKYELELLNFSLDKLKYQVELEYFSKTKDALEYLQKTRDEIFLIISEFSLEALKLKEFIDNDKALWERSIPFVFAGNSATREEVSEAYKHKVHGFFTKPYSMEAMTEILDIIIKYWAINWHPNKKQDLFERVK